MSHVTVGWEKRKKKFPYGTSQKGYLCKMVSDNGTLNGKESTVPFHSIRQTCDAPDEIMISAVAELSVTPRKISSAVEFKKIISQ